MPKPLDIAFVVRVDPMADVGDPALYRPLRMSIDGQEASLPFLRQYVGNDRSLDLTGRVQAQFEHFGGLPVLTPYLLQAYYEARNISFEAIPCLASGWDRLEQLAASDIRVVAISTTWARGVGSAESFRDAARRIRSRLPGVVIVAGGIGVQKGVHSRQLLEEGTTPVPPDVLAEQFLGIDAAKDADFDCLVFGSHPEATLQRIVELLREGEDFRDLPNLAVPRGSGYKVNERVTVTGALGSTIVDWGRHYREIFPLWTPVFTSVGCPFRCEFCDFFPLFKCELRDEQQVIAELKTLKRAPYPRLVFFTDDNFGMNRPRLVRILKGMIKARLGIKWFAFIRADVIDEEVAGLLKKSGCYELLLGIESGDPTVLANMKKRLDLDVAKRNIEHLDAVGINSQCTIVVGFPGENGRSIDNTVDWLSSLPAGPSANAMHRYYLFRLAVSALSPLSHTRQREQFGLQGLAENWSHKTMSAAEAGDAMREIFCRVNGPTHVYMEPLTLDWPVRVTRDIMETRERAQQQICQSNNADNATRAELLRKITDANRKYALSPLTKKLIRAYYRLKGIRL